MCPTNWRNKNCLCISSWINVFWKTLCKIICQFCSYFSRVLFCRKHKYIIFILFISILFLLLSLLVLYSPLQFPIYINIFIFKLKIGYLFSVNIFDCIKLIYIFFIYLEPYLLGSTFSCLNYECKVPYTINITGVSFLPLPVRLDLFDRVTLLPYAQCFVNNTYASCLLVKMPFSMWTCIFFVYLFYLFNILL